MPRVSKESIHLTGIGTFTVEIFFSARHKIFSIKLPEEIKRVLGKDEVQSDTFNGVKDNFRKAIDNYEEAQTVIRKVIIYRFRVTAYIFDEKEDRCIFREEQIGFAEGTALELSYDVCTERTLSGKKSYYYLNGNFNCDAGRDADMKAMEWTEQRETFFKALKHSLEQTILKAHKFFNANPDDITKFIDSGGKLLLPEYPKENNNTKDKNTNRGE